MSTKKYKILMFEDDQFLRSMYETKFTAEGFEITGYESPSKDPVSIILKEKPDIIISGVIMPLMTGFDAAKLYKSDPRTKNIPLIFLTNLGMRGDVEFALKLGAFSYLIKAHKRPIEVVNEVRRALGLPIPPENPIPPPGEAWHGPTVQDQLDRGSTPSKKPWWKRMFG